MIDTEGWQPIATAPRDEEVMFLGWDCHNGFYVSRFDYFFASETGRVAKFADHDWSRRHPTHWMPLPAAPVTA